MTSISLSLTGEQHKILRKSLYPGDGKESVAILLCGSRAGERRHRLVVTEIHPLPMEAYSERRSDRTTWSTESIVPFLERAEDKGWSVVKAHSHPNGFSEFSRLDDRSDADLFPCIRGWVEADVPHASIVMLPDGEIFGRYWNGSGGPSAIDSISVVGDELHFWYPHVDERGENEGFEASHRQAFGTGTTEQLRRLDIAVVGCSGTGSPVIEQLMRLGVGRLLLVDDDTMEKRNVNRILNSTMEDALAQRPKVEVLAEAIQRTGLGTEVEVLRANLWDPTVVRAVAECDVVFGCMDTVDGRFLLNTLATYYSIPYIDVGVKLDAAPDGEERGRIREICGAVHYLQPGRSSLMSRGLFSMAEVAAAGLARSDPAAYAQQLSDGYIGGVVEHAPAVVSVNMFAASLAVQELLARLHPFREQPGAEYGSVEFSLQSMEFFPEPEVGRCEVLRDVVGMGDVEPPLGLLELAEVGRQ